MKKPILLLLLLFAVFKNVKAQELVSSEQFQKLIGYLNDENWKDAADLSETYLKAIPGDKIDWDAAAIVRYMYLTSESGLMNSGGITQQEALKKVSRFAGHTIIFPWRSVTVAFGMNKIMPHNDKADTLMVTATNRKATSIFAFEYIVPVPGISLDDLKSFAGKSCRVNGTLKSVSVEGHILPRYRLLIDKASLKFGE